jgi:hypothetical protein
MNKKRTGPRPQHPDRRGAYDGVCESIRIVAGLLDHFNHLNAEQVRAGLSRIHDCLLQTRQALPRPKNPEHNNVKTVVFGAQSSHRIADNVTPHARVWLGTGQTRTPGSHRSS